MKASYFEFRFRVWIMTLIIALGFWAPWTEWLNFGTRTTTWLWLGFQFGALGVSATTGIFLSTTLAIAIAAAAAGIRLWGTAYLGTNTVTNREMKADRVLADGPYRYVRNPLYIGSFLTMAAISILMPTSGTVFALVLLTIFLFRLILGEEAFLAAQLGSSYRQYLHAVPRLIPSLRPRVAAGGQRPHWGDALLGEILPLGVFLSFATLSWQYNSQLLIRAVLISFGLSLVARAAFAKPKGSEPSAV
jgi:protein-S-isoprenylcysteine O-methyltransferase Ste14